MEEGTRQIRVFRKDRDLMRIAAVRAGLTMPEYVRKHLITKRNHA